MAMYRKWLRKWTAWRRSCAERWFRAGTVLRGRYAVVKPLGEGSYGVAYLCKDLRQGSLCVLKRIQPMRGGKARTKAVYGLETEMLTKLKHPSIPRLYERFVYRGYSCFTMEFAPGTSLEKLLFDDGVPFSEEDSLRIADKLLGILDFVHRQGIVHRDVRIANVIIDGDAVRLIDFGLARRLSDAADGRLPDDVYESDPMEKQIRRRIDVTSDFYALGHLLLFMLYSRTQPLSPNLERSWEEELTLMPETKKLLRRLLLAEQPSYTHAAQVQADVRAVLERLRAVAT